MDKRQLVAGWSRTHIFRIRPPLLYQLRYSGGHPPVHFLVYLCMWTKLSLGMLVSATHCRGGRCEKSFQQQASHEHLVKHKSWFPLFLLLAAQWGSWLWHTWCHELTYDGLLAIACSQVHRLRDSCRRKEVPHLPLWLWVVLANTPFESCKLT